ncbi:MAG: asparagine synthase (glutamine-hydrolyzing) [Salinivirgaceae bacterium]|nr:asparagine synthase (glutamine-hydrolyzing) [Salinivirgaceae bacterium]
MCGITGVYQYSEIQDQYVEKTRSATNALRLRGPDNQQVLQVGKAVLGHARLSIIDLSNAASQPFTDPSGRYSMVYNGEFFNFLEHRKALSNKGYTFQTNSDTEVILALYIEYGADFLPLINGFFALAIYDKLEDTIFLARDRYGVKPLLFHRNETRMVFASEMKALVHYDIPRTINQSVLYSYFVHNYIPGDESIINNVSKIPAGHYMVCNGSNMTAVEWYKMPQPATLHTSYKDAVNQLETLLDNAVETRLISDVPLGCFLSGGVDSSIIAAIASRYKPNLMTFSLGFPDQPFYDETKWAEKAANHLGTNHHSIQVTNRELIDNLPNVLNYLDEPFADSSAILVNILAKETRKHVTIALSGDGADELFAGYRKHMAHYQAIKYKKYRHLAQMANPFLKLLPQSRNNSFTDKIRQLYRFSEGISLTPEQRYVLWTSISNPKEVNDLLVSNVDKSPYNAYIESLTASIKSNESIGEITKADLKMVLQGDMLPKVDLMSMANSLEVRSPFLDYRVVEFGLSLQDNYKVYGKMRKRILQDTYRDKLPEELFTRPKKGFEVPLTKWMRNELFELIDKDLLNKDYIINQGIFNYKSTEKLKKQLFTNNVGDSPSKLWALIVFQNWYKKYIENSL